MSSFVFEGSLNGVSEAQLEYIGRVLKEQGYKDGKVLFEAVGKAGDNYVANVKRIIVEKDGKPFKMIAKIAYDIEQVREIMNTAILFNNEHYMYTEVLPKFTEMLKAANVPTSERLRYATCYGTTMEAPNEVILLEDLRVTDYVMLDRFKSFTDDTVKLVLRNFAILHSLSYALKHQEPETYKDFNNKLVDAWALMSGSEQMQQYFEQFEEEIQKIVVDERYKKIIKGHLTKLSEVCMMNSKIDGASKYSVIEQGDSWTNNIMFKIEDDKAVKCCMIDYQISKKGSPVGDIHYMIFNTTDYETRSKHYHDWIDYYHLELERCLAKFDLKIEEIYPRTQFDADLLRFATKSFGMSLLLAGMLIRESAEVEDFKDAMEKGASLEEIVETGKLTKLTEASTIRFKKRVEGLIDSFVELGYIVVK